MGNLTHERKREIFKAIQRCLPFLSGHAIIIFYKEDAELIIDYKGISIILDRLNFHDLDLVDYICNSIFVESNINLVNESESNNYRNISLIEEYPELNNFMTTCCYSIIGSGQSTNSKCSLIEDDFLIMDFMDKIPWVSK